MLFFLNFDSVARNFLRIINECNFSYGPHHLDTVKEMQLVSGDIILSA
jgi:hypothetical protein